MNIFSRLTERHTHTILIFCIVMIFLSIFIVTFLIFFTAK